MGNCVSRRSKTRQQLIAAEERYDGALAAFAAQEKQLLITREKLRINELDIHSISSQAQAHQSRIQELDAQNIALMQTNFELDAGFKQSAKDSRDYQNIADAMMQERDNVLIRLQDLREHTKTLAQDYGKRLREIKNTMEQEHESTRALLQQFHDLLQDQENKVHLKNDELLSQQQLVDKIMKERDEARASAEDYKLLLKSYEDASPPKQFEFEDARARCEQLLGSLHPFKQRNRATTGFLDTSILHGRPRKDSGVQMDDEPDDADDGQQWSP